MIWRMLLFGDEGSAFRLHYDHTALAAWQAPARTSTPCCAM